MIHTYSLIHDDLPAMDDDSLRRGKPTSHVVFGEAMAILAGDALHTHAFHALANSDGVAPARLVRAMAILADAAGAGGMVGGQVADMEAEDKPVDATTLEFIHRHKTGALIRASAEVGALIGGGTEDDVTRFARYGEHIGLAFQIIDDILDVTSDTATLGKSAGKDKKAGKATYPHVHGIEAATARAHELARLAVAALDGTGARAGPLVQIAERIVERSS